MRIGIVAAGSRGDVQPLVGLGAGLRARGHEVEVLALADFEPMVTAAGLAFRSFGASSAEQLDSALGRRWLAGSSHNGAVELRHLSRFVQAWAGRIAAKVVEFGGQADLYISGVLTVHAVAAMASRYGGQHVLAQLSPLQASRSGMVTLQPPHPERSSLANLASSSVIEWLTAGAFRTVGDEALRRLGMAATGRRGFLRAVQRTPALIGASPLLVPAPADWPAHRHVTGYWFLDRSDDWRPPADLVGFIDGGPPPVAIGFGSMSSDDAPDWSAMIVEAVRRARVRAILLAGAAGLTAPADTDDVHVVGPIPHDWLFPRVGAVVHHGGAGTTAAALRAGVTSMAIPHIGDQPFWGRRLNELGVGPPALPRHQVSVTTLTQRLIELSTPEYRVAAQRIGEQIRAEDGVGVAARVIADVVAATR